MPSSSRLLDQLYFLRRLIGLSALVGVLCSTCPVPLAWKVWQPGQTPFPCQSCGCGCSTAEQCWFSCCCYSLSERIAWARQHGVAIPEAILVQEPSLAKRTPAAKSACCTTSAACCGKSDASDTDMCTAVGNGKSSSNGEVASELNDQDEPSDSSTTLIVSLQAIECQGGATAFTLLPWAVVDKPPTGLTLLQPLAEFSPIVDENSEPAVSAVDPPPPRSC